MSHTDADPQSHDTPSQSDVPVLATRIVIGELDRPLMEIMPWQSDTMQRGTPVALDVEQRSAMSALLSQMPALIQSAHSALGQAYHLSFPPEVLQKMSKVMDALGGGKRAIAVGPKGEIVGHGVLNPANGAKALSAATAVWQGLAIVTAQVHLVEINARLAKIEQGIDSIKAFLEAEQVSKLVTGLRYVREASTALARGDVDEQERRLIAAQAEMIWLECGQVAHTCLQLLGRAPQDFKKLQLNAWYDLGNSADLAQQALTYYERRASAYFLAVYVRSATVALRQTLHLSQGISEERSKEIQRHVAEWRANRDAFFHVAQERVANDLSATLSKQTTINIERRLLLDYTRESQDRLDSQCDALEQIARRLQDRLQQPLDLVVTLDQHGQIAEAFQMPTVQSSLKQTVERSE